MFRYGATSILLTHSHFAGTVRTQGTVLLGTAIVRVRDRSGTLQCTRILLDSGSQVSAITADCVARLGLDRRRCHTEIVGLAQSPVNKVRGATSCSFVPHHAVTPMITCEDLIILPRITALMPSIPLPKGVRHKYQHLTLADPQFDIPAPVDMLIGDDVFPSIVCSKGEIIHTEGFPSALETLLGWIFIGTVGESEDRSFPLTSFSVSLAPSVDTLLRQFWSVEEPTQSAIPTTEDQMCDKWFTETTVRDESGRFCVALPFRDVINTSSNKKSLKNNLSMDCYSHCHGLGDSRRNALKRLYNLELRLNKDLKLYEAYRKFMDEYLSLGHMKIATSLGKYFIPHHAVMKQDGDVSKLRVVFDASYFLTCKTKVAPMKLSSAPHQTLSIPRLDLCAAYLLAQLLQRLHTTLSSSVEISLIHVWTDSSIVLSWLKADQKVFKNFITNRVAKIHDLIPNCEWSHISTSDNSADPSSRGLFPNTMVSCHIHWHGPSFIYLAEKEWPKSTFTSINVEQLPDIKVTKQTYLVSNNIPSMDNFLNRFSTLNRLQRSTSYVLRFIYACFFDEPCQKGSLSCRELNRAMRVLIRTTQQMYFSSLFTQFAKPNTVITPPTVTQLASFIDTDGLIRVGGRLRHSLLSSDSKHPYLLPKSAHLTSLLICNYHLTYLHAGPKLVLSMLRQKYWIISGRDAVRRSIFTCVTCTRHKAQHPKPLMGNLPKSRVQGQRPFLHVGMDYGDPFLVKESCRRNTKIVKIYVALFICMAIKAIHIEIVSDLTSDTFLAALLDEEYRPTYIRIVAPFMWALLDN